MFRFSMSTISRQGRSDSRSAVAAAAYRSGQQITDARSEQTWDYSPRKRDIAFSEITLPAGVSEQWKDRSFLWNSVETHNRRKDSLLAREIQLAIPAELSAEERVALIHEISQAIADEHSVAVDGNIHKPDRKHIGDERNWHAHLQITANRFEGDSLGKKAREFDAAQGGGELVEYWRAKWAAMCNGALERHGSETRVDHRSYKRQGIDRVGVSLPYNAWRMEMNGEASLVGDLAIEREADHGGLEVEDARESRADAGTLAAPGIGTWDWANWAGEWDPWADMGEPGLSLEGGVPVEDGPAGEALGTLVSEGIPVIDAPGAEVSLQAGGSLAAVAGDHPEPVQRDLRNSTDRLEPGPARSEGTGEELAEPGRQAERLPDAAPRSAGLRSPEPGDLEPVGDPGRQLRPVEAAALAAPPAPGGHQPEGKPVLPGGGPVGGGPGVRLGPVPADPLPARGGSPAGAGPVAAAAGTPPVALETLPAPATKPKWLGPRGIRAGLVIPVAELPEWVEGLQKETQSGLGKLNVFKKPDMLREEAYIRERIGLPPIPRPGATWPERQVDLVRDGQALANAKTQALAQAQAITQAEAAIVARRDAQAQARRKTTGPGEFPSWLTKQPEKVWEAIGDNWALTHEPLGDRLPTPAVIQELAGKTGISIGLGPKGHTLPWSLPDQVAADRRFNDPNMERAEWSLRKETKLPQRDQAYYEKPWPVRQPELVQDGWRKVWSQLAQSMRESLREAESTIRQSSIVRNLTHQLESFRRPLQERRQAAQEVSRAARATQAPQLPQASKKAPQKPSQDKGGWSH